MADLTGTTVIHGNHGYFLFDGEVVGRAKNINMTVEGGVDEFYEVGSAWIQDIEIINRKVTVEIERGSIDFKLLAYSVGVNANLNDTTTTIFQTAAGTSYDLLIDEASTRLTTISNDAPVITAPFVLDVTIVVNKILSPTTLDIFTVTARDCKINRHGISAPNSAYWTTNLSLTGKGITLAGVTHSIV